ncbi:hypothetical protein RSOLAG1IB_08273 [Rhizoctonia solani AG-1 IB]|uniref:C2H2-type domain-containing protein n=1 Tax=Thanatephorus cucumeris (strain AG1-IB / isolate 7/3/14) TaxID=1108050 RepID=A0A0B7FHB0_THACB|nr:hypothetical protein RSOLAG1IB_08273 [Rhizoctonia solani AG-1 IB]
MSTLSLPPHLRATLALPDTRTTEKDIQQNNMVGRTSTPEDTPIYICTIDGCNKLFPSRERLGGHRKRDHGSDDTTNNVLTWNE